MEDTVFVGFTSFCNEHWISFGAPQIRVTGGHAIRWKTWDSQEESLSERFGFGISNVKAVVQLRQRIIIRTGQAPDVRDGSVDNVLLQLVQLALKDNLV